ncbi:MAG TPA: hypothetical protein VNW47_11465 [Terriglobales bacterium]|jgi:hypothetical protein|nr:hypothetical protein [Terriglobales bacterium]
MNFPECGAGVPAREMLEARTNPKKVSAMRGIAVPFRIFVATLREIFDESAYERFLSRSQQASSQAAYQTFLRESQVSRERRPQCC